MFAAVYSALAWRFQLADEDRSDARRYAQRIYHRLRSITGRSNTAPGEAS